MLAEVIQFFLSPIFTLVDPYFNRFTDAIFSLKTRRVIVKSIIASGVIGVLIGIALISYLGFYWLYVPSISHVKPVYLQYHQDTLPTAVIDFTAHGSYFLTADQAYDVSVDLYVPTSESNVGLGNFMIDLKLNSRKANNETVQHGSRPCLLTYQSPLLRIVSTLWHVPFYLLTKDKESQALEVIMFEDMIENSAKPISHAYLTVSDPRLQTYTVRIRFDAHFRGLRYFMYYQPLPTAVIFISLFMFWEFLFSLIAWKSCVSWWQSKTTQRQRITATGDKSQTGTAAGAEEEGLDGVWETVHREDTVGRSEGEGGTSTDADSEFEGSRPASIISRSRTTPAPYSESGETGYTTESYETDDGDQSVSRRTRDDEGFAATETETEDDIEDRTEGSATPTTRSRRTSVSGISSTTEDESEREPAGASTSRAPMSTSRPYVRHVTGAGIDSDTNAGDA